MMHTNLAAMKEVLTKSSGRTKTLLIFAGLPVAVLLSLQLYSFRELLAAEFLFGLACIFILLVAGGVFLIGEISNRALGFVEARVHTPKGTGFPTVRTRSRF